MLGPLLGGWLLQVAGFSTAFVTAGTLGVIAVLLFFLMRLPPVPGRVNRETLNVKREESDDSRITNNAVRPPGPAAVIRSEEHTSELQSPCNLVCRLLLEKKKKNRDA